MVWPHKGSKEDSYVLNRFLVMFTFYNEKSMNHNINSMLFLLKSISNIKHPTFTMYKLFMCKMSDGHFTPDDIFRL